MEFYLRVTGQKGDATYVGECVQKFHETNGLEPLEVDEAFSKAMDEYGEVRLIISRERIAGMITVAHYGQPKENIGRIRFLWVDEAFRGQGLAYNAILHIMRGYPFKNWVADTGQNEAARNLFKKHGFESFDESPDMMIRKIDEDPNLTCVHRGEPVANIYCKPCKSKTGRGRMVTVFGCELHEHCTLNNEMVRYNKKRSTACSTCEDRQEVKRDFRLDIGMACFDDYEGVWFTIQAMRLEARARNIPADIRFIIIDNHPVSAHGRLLNEFADQCEDVRYVAYTDRQGTSGPRDEVFKRSDADAVVCVDSHILLWPGSLAALVEYFVENPESKDLVQGLLLWDNLIPDHGATHMDPVSWDANMWGKWAHDERGAKLGGEPFDIPMQGLWLFGCRREAWLGFNEYQRGFGSEEGYIHEKFRQAGRRTLMLPSVRGVHKFGKPEGVKYPNNLPDICRNYVISHYELGLPMEPIQKHFVDELNLPIDMFELFISEAKRIYNAKS